MLNVLKLSVGKRRSVSDFGIPDAQSIAEGRDLENDHPANTVSSPCVINASYASAA